MGRLVKLIGSGIGLASEAMAARSQNNSPNLNPNNGESSRSAPRSPHFNEPPPQYVEVSDDQAERLYSSGRAVPADYKGDHKGDHKGHEYDDDDDDATSEEGDEEQWDLDDAAEEQMGPGEQMGHGDNEPVQDARQLTNAFMRNHPPPAYSQGIQPRGRLPCPVILPQRRPRKKTRGFVRAYAPVLEDCGIDQATFLDFLKTFHASSRSDPYLTVINVGAGIAGFVPSGIAMGVSIAVKVAVGVAEEVQVRQRTNSFLDHMNNEFFKPRGLYCLIMTYKPESSATHASIDINQSISSAMTPASSGMSSMKKNLRLSSGQTHGEFEMPEAAPLIFPALDQLADSTSADGGRKQSSMKSKSKFVADYFDRRAQALYAAENPNSSLAVGPSPGFASRYADPNHAANSGSLISLVTGGALNPKGRRAERRSARKISGAERRGESITAQTGQRRKGGIVRKMLQKNILYLMIINLPSEAELAAGRQAVANEQRYQSS